MINPIEINPIIIITPFFCLLFVFFLCLSLILYLFLLLISSSSAAAKVRVLPVGDFVWVLPTAAGEAVYPAVIERKTWDDLAASILDGRSVHACSGWVFVDLFLFCFVCYLFVSFVLFCFFFCLLGASMLYKRYKKNVCECYKRAC